MLKLAFLLKPFIPIKSSVRHYPYPITYIQFLKNQPGTQVSKIQNGLTIASEHRMCPNVCVGLFIDAGSRYETKNENGIAHFFEHIAFKSTAKKDQARLEVEMACTGAKFRCFTTREMCVYYAECMSADVPGVVEILADCIFNNAFNCDTIEAQKAIVYAEMLELDQDTNVLVSDYLHASAFQGTPLGQSVMGTSLNLTNWDQGVIMNYIRRMFTPQRTVLAAVGGITHDQLETVANTYLSMGEAYTESNDCDVYRYTGSDVRYRNDGLPAGNVAIAVEAPCLCDHDKVYMDIATSFLGAWDQSQYGGQDHAASMARRSSLGKLCDAYEGFYITYKDTGLWGVKFVSTALQQEDMMFNIQDLWMQMCMLMTEGELQRAKRELKTKLLYETESCLGACMDIGRYVLYNCEHRPPVVDRLRAIDWVTVDKFKETLTKYIYDRCPVVAAVGQVEGLTDYTRIRSHMYWLRV